MKFIGIMGLSTVFFKSVFVLTISIDFVFIRNSKIATIRKYSIFNFTKFLIHFILTLRQLGIWVVNRQYEADFLCVEICLFTLNQVSLIFSIYRCAFLTVSHEGLRFEAMDFSQVSPFNQVITRYSFLFKILKQRSLHISVKTILSKNQSLNKGDY